MNGNNYSLCIRIKQYLFSINYQDLKRAKETFPIHRYEKEYKELESIRLAFVRQFSKQEIANLTIDQFVEGKGDPASFCYRLERKFGWIRTLKPTDG